MSESCATIVAAIITGGVGLIAAGIIWWQAKLLQRQIALSTFLELDKQWDSEAMIETRQNVRSEDGSWNISRLEGVLEFFEKLAMLERTKALNEDDVFDSTLIWYLARYFLFSRHQIEQMRTERWKDDVYNEVQDLYRRFLEKEVQRRRTTADVWERTCKETESDFWEGERED
jgi:hypothetical protein